MSNIQLTGTLAKIPHVEIKSVHYTATPNGSTLSISTKSCAGYHDACAALEAKGSTDVGGHEKLPSDGHEVARWRT